MRNVIICILACVAIAFSSCQNDKGKAEALLEEIRSNVEAGEYEKALLGVDSLRRTYPKEIEARKAALTLHQEASLKLAQANLERIDRELQSAETSYDSLNAIVTAHRKAMQATQDELHRLNLLRASRDSLKGVFDVECARIKYIHKRQKE